MFVLLTHFARQDRQNGNLKNKQNHATKVTKIRKNENDMSQTYVTKARNGKNYPTQF